MFRLLALVALFGATVAASGNYKQVIDGDSVLVTLEDPEFYALSAPELKQFNWASVNMMATQVSVVTPDCQSNQKGIKDLGEVERRVLESVTKRLKDMQQSERSQSQRRISSGNRETLYKNESADSSELYSLQHGDFSLELLGYKHYVIQTKRLAAQSIKWLLIDGDLVTFIYSDGRSIRMQPLLCLDEGKRNLLRGLYDEFVAAKDSLKLSWKNMHDALTQRLADEHKGREQQDRVQYEHLIDRLENDRKQQAEGDRTKHTGLIDRLEGEYQHRKRQESDRHRQLIDRLEAEQQKHDSAQQRKDQETISRLEREYKQRVEDEQRKHMQLVDRLEREYKQRVESQLKQHLVLIGRLEREYKQRKEDETSRYHKLMDRLEREYDQRRRNLDSSLRKAVETKSWLKIQS